MLWRNIIIVCFLMFQTSSCGFTPMYATSSSPNEAVGSVLPSIKIARIQGQLGQRLTTHLLEELNPSAIKTPYQYKLKVSLRKESAAIGIQQDREATRFNIIIRAKYQLIDIDSKEVVDSGTIKVVGSYDAVDSQYATFIAEEDTSFRIMKELAKDIKTRLSISLSQG